jgi:hypothetical protein
VLGVGVIDPPWYPEEVNLDHFKISDKLAKSDKSVPPKQRGKDKVGGLLAQLDSKAAETRVHNPLKPTIISNLEFSAVRKKRTLGDRLAEINELKVFYYYFIFISYFVIFYFVFLFYYLNNYFISKI